MALILRMQGVVEATGLGERTIRRMVAEGTFPRPVQLRLRAKGWLLEDVTRWVEGRASEKAA